MPGEAWNGANRTLLYLVVFALFAVLPWTLRSARIAAASYALGVTVVAAAALYKVADTPARSCSSGRARVPDGVPERERRAVHHGPLGGAGGRSAAGRDAAPSRRAARRRDAARRDRAALPEPRSAGRGARHGGRRDRDRARTRPPRGGPGAADCRGCAGVGPHPRRLPCRGEPSAAGRRVRPGGPLDRRLVGGGRRAGPRLGARRPPDRARAANRDVDRPRRRDRRARRGRGRHRRRQQCDRSAPARPARVGPVHRRHGAARRSHVHFGGLGTNRWDFWRVGMDRLRRASAAAASAPTTSPSTTCATAAAARSLSTPQRRGAAYSLSRASSGALLLPASSRPPPPPRSSLRAAATARLGRWRRGRARRLRLLARARLDRLVLGDPRPRCARLRLPRPRRGVGERHRSQHPFRSSPAPSRAGLLLGSAAGLGVAARRRAVPRPAVAGAETWSARSSRGALSAGAYAQLDLPGASTAE